MKPHSTLLSLTLLMTASTAWAETPITHDALQDLTGMWRIESIDESPKDRFEFAIEKTKIGICLDSPCETHTSFYRVLTGGLKLGKWNLVGLSIATTHGGNPTIRWTRIRTSNDGIGSELDGEFSQILRIEKLPSGFRFYLGGDFGTREYAVMERVPGWTVLP